MQHGQGISLVIQPACVCVGRCEKCEQLPLFMEKLFHAVQHRHALELQKAGLPMKKADVDKLTEEEKQAKTGTVETVHALFARLRRIEKSLECYRAHLLRHANQNRFKCYMQGDGTGVGCCASIFVVDDFWGKLQERLQWVAVCEQGKANRSVSVLGRVGTLLNPDLDVRQLHSDMDWGQYPDPPSEGGPKYVRITVRAFSDSSTQSALDTGATRAALDARVFQENPWLASVAGGGIALQSDGASNFTCTQAVCENYLNKRVSCVLISVEGMGKDAVDRDNAQCQSVLKKKMRSTKTELTDAAGFAEATKDQGGMSVVAEPGNVESSSASVVQATSKDSPVEMRFKLYTFDREARTITMYEQFDEARSVELQRPVGFGPGKVVSADELGISRDAEAEHWRRGDSATKGVLLDLEVTEKSEESKPVLAAQPSHEQKVQAKMTQREERERKRQKRLDKEKALAAERDRVRKVHVSSGSIHQCPHCPAVYVSSQRLQAHLSARRGDKCPESRRGKLEHKRNKLKAEQVASR